MLLDVCSSFALEHDIIFNNTKSQVMFVEAYEPFVINPRFMLSNMALSYTSQYKYLGHLLTNDLRDDSDVLKQVRSLYGRANLLLRKFRKTGVQTKVMLFNAFCSPVYGCQLWCNSRKETFNRLRVAYNNALRLLLNVFLGAVLA